MIVFAREVYACRCNTDVPEDDPDASDVARNKIFTDAARPSRVILPIQP